VCGKKARLGPDYAGKAIRCPDCGSAQIVPDPRAISRANWPALPDPDKQKNIVPTMTEEDPGGDKMLFLCSACGYRARIPAKYAGTVVLCPSCNATQIANQVAEPGIT